MALERYLNEINGGRGMGTERELICIQWIWAQKQYFQRQAFCSHFVIKKGFERETTHTDAQHFYRVVGGSNGQSLLVILLGNLLPRATITVLHEEIILLKVNKFLNQITVSSEMCLEQQHHQPWDRPCVAGNFTTASSWTRWGKHSQQKKLFLLQKILPTDSSNCFG